MARNRTEFVTQVINKIAAIVTISKHRDVLNNELAASINFRKDVKSSTIVATVSANNIDFTSNDLVTIDGATNNLDLILTILNTEDGEDSKYIRVIKDAAKTVTFSGATNISYPNNTRDLTEVIYQVYNKNGTILVKALTQQNSAQYPILVEIGDWNMDSTSVITVTHGLVNYKKVKGIQVIIRDDSDVGYYYIPAIDVTGSVNGIIGTLTATTLGLGRVAGGLFDSTDFDSTSYNRGSITFWIEP